jgi:hypothetical protein
LWGCNLGGVEVEDVACTGGSKAWKASCRRYSEEEEEKKEEADRQKRKGWSRMPLQMGGMRDGFRRQGFMAVAGPAAACRRGVQIAMNAVQKKLGDRWLPNRASGYLKGRAGRSPWEIHIERLW